jgi:tRNA(fMet)-specific endonuclease VapC
MRYLLDTNTCIAAMRNHPGVLSKMSGLAPGDCAVSTINSYELYTGVEKCADPTKERAKVQLLLTTIHELPFDAQAVKRAAQIRATLEAQGKSIGPYDTLLAGHALAVGLIVVSANVAELGRVPGLTLENWESPMPTP